MLPKKIKNFFLVRREQWIKRKAPRVEKWQTTNRRIYILPTRYGTYYLFLSMVMLLCSINYGNSMAFSLTFLLMGIGLVTFYKTHANILNLQFQNDSNPSPIFLSETGKFNIKVKNLSKRKKYSLEVYWSLFAPNEKERKFFDVESKTEEIYPLLFYPQKRGWYDAPRIRLTSRFPLGIGRAWSWIELDMKCLVYPKPIQFPYPIEKESENQEGKYKEKSGSDEFSTLRGYKPGDPIKLINWKTFQPYKNPMVKEFIENVGGEVWLDWQKMPTSLNNEDKISFLTFLIIEMNKDSINYGLKLPTEEIKPAHGDNHFHYCLQKLALY